MPTASQKDAVATSQRREAERPESGAAGSPAAGRPPHGGRHEGAELSGSRPPPIGVFLEVSFFCFEIDGTGFPLVLFSFTGAFLNFSKRTLLSSPFLGLSLVLPGLSVLLWGLPFIEGLPFMNSWRKMDLRL